jgi:hypothetical protein
MDIIIIKDGFSTLLQIKKHTCLGTMCFLKKLQVWILLVLELLSDVNVTHQDSTIELV